MVLLSPALRVKLYVPLAIPGLRLLQQSRKNRPAFVKSYVRSTMLTHDAEQARRYDDDPLFARSIAVNILLGLHDTATRLMDDAGAINVPTLLLAAGKSDWVVRLDAQQQFFDRLSSPVKRMQVFDRMHHAILHEVDRQQVYDAIRSFLDDRFNAPPPADPLIDADKAGYTQEEHDRLRQPLPALSPKRWSFAAQRLVLGTAGRLCDGIRLGWETGFDSGQSLDYIYQNQPRGRLLIGRWADRVYLNAVGWRGIRQRRANIQKLLHQAINEIRTRGEPVRIMDIAAGCGRYVLEVVAQQPKGSVASVLLRDKTPANLEAAKSLADKLGFGSIQFSQADAFEEQSLAEVEPPPNVTIVWGLYELFSDNQKILASLRGIARAMHRGGVLIYTGQPWHPQLEMIARVLTNRDGQPWIMRRRTQQELDDLVRSAGFEKETMEIDEHGIFTVSLARLEGRS